MSPVGNEPSSSAHTSSHSSPRRQPQRIPAQQRGQSQAPAQIREAPAQRPQRIVGVGEQLGGQLAPLLRALRQRDTGQQRP